MIEWVAAGMTGAAAASALASWLRSRPRGTLPRETKGSLALREGLDQHISLLEKLETDAFYVTEILKRDSTQASLKIRFAHSQPDVDFVLKVFSSSEGRNILAAQREHYALHWLNGAAAPEGAEIVRSADQSSLGLVRRWVPGATLHSYLQQRRTTLTLLEADRLMSGLLDAVGQVHRAGIIHCDVKPSNVVADWGSLLQHSAASSAVTLIDFGLSMPRISSDPAEGRETNWRFDVLSGTPGFTAPERMWFSAALPASDLYSVAAILKFGLGQFASDAPRLPDALNLVLSRALASDPSERFRDVNSFRGAWSKAFSQVKETFVDAWPTRSLSITDDFARTIMSGGLMPQIGLAGEALQGLRKLEPELHKEFMRAMQENSRSLHMPDSRFFDAFAREVFKAAGQRTQSAKGEEVDHPDETP